MKKSAYLILLLGVLTLSACSGYNKVVKSDDYDRKFEMANELYDKGQELRAVVLYEQVYQCMPKTGEGELAYFRIGKGYFLNKDYIMAGYYLAQFAQRFPFSPKAEEAMFLSAMCSVEASPEASLDQTETEIAINNLQQFIDRYPDTPLLDTSNLIIDQLRFKLEVKSYNSVKIYSKTENFHAAVSSALTFFDDYPRSKFTEEIHYILVKNSYLLCKNSIESKKMERIEDTFERYRTFVVQFPESKYRSTLAEYYDLLVQEKEKLTLSNK